MTIMGDTLKFSLENAKLDKRLIFNIPAGYTCPRAGVCRTFADKDTGKITDNPTGCSDSPNYRCFAAMAEARFPSVRKARWHNQYLIRQVRDTAEDTTKSYIDIANLISKSMDAYPHRDLIRIHESGDFWFEFYMKAWMRVARERSEQKFYAYTKCLDTWYQLRNEIPDNFYLTASYGGQLDHMLIKYPDVYKRIAYVVYSEEEAEKLGLEIDHDDSHCFGDKPFALLVHGSQEAGSEAAQAIAQRRKEKGFTGYNKNTK